MTWPSKLRLFCLISLLVCTVGCDQTVKHMARVVLSRDSSRSLTGGFIELKLAENPGSFLSLGALLPAQVRFSVFTFGVGVGLVALAVYLTSRTRIGPFRFIGLSLVMAGGIGNLLDRILRHGLVTDFAVIHVGPIHTGIFNVADVLIVAGTGFVLYSLGKRQNPNDPITGRNESVDTASVQD